MFSELKLSKATLEELDNWYRKGWISVKQYRKEIKRRFPEI